MIQSIIGTSFTGGGGTQPSTPTFVADNYNPLEGTTITFTISGITDASEGTTLYWWIDGTSGQYSRADQFVENIDNDTLQLSPDGNGALGGTFTLTPNQGDINFNFYIGYSLYGGFLNLSSDVVVIENIPFDVTANWGLTTPEVVDEASFKTFLESGQDGNNNTNSLTNVTITDFSLVNGRLICNLSATGINLYLNNIEISEIVSIGRIMNLGYLNLNNNQIVTFDPSIALPNLLQNLNLYNNQIVTFDPSIALPNSLQYLVLDNNQIVTFDPSQALPNSLQQLFLKNNQIVTFDPSIALPNSLETLGLDNNQIVTFDPSIALPNSLKQLRFASNQIVTFDPTITLPNSLELLYLDNNQMTTAGYTASESWANTMSPIPNRGFIYFNNNVNSVSGTNLQTILISKGWTVTV
jgi:Leucine-rich repeat (LRR) protein